ncbi:methionine--tRNA ligase [Entomobacter blattae]|uniref:Methionine--tRNA ligase n=1 Tax=Entomobacter blattae TaxID=2762277 RepID=A0A7H1NT14_9PROT|nr:methionine--tRNA ligase [Entomobacter blattae]QNT78924.1 Methionine--tRNA ligase [Entomobacter blattae]
MSARYMVTTPIYYVNGSPHIGHAYTSIAADVIARFKRLDGLKVFFLTGTDEHGQKVEQAASSHHIAPQALADKISQAFRDTADKLNISYDHFIRTTDTNHKQGAQALWKKVAESGNIYLGAYEGWYALRDECFYTEDELTTQPDGKKIAPTGAEVEWVKEPSYFFRLSQWQDKLLSLYENNPHFIGPESRKNEIINFVKSGLKDLSISRTSFQWGIPVPGDENHVMYVWFDALANYISALGYPESQSDLWAFWPANLHLVGKEIARFHAVYWPAFLMAAGIELPARIYSHGWWTVEGEKMSKSVGNVINPSDLVDEFGLDAVRFFLMREIPFGGDGNFSRESLIRRMNVELANDLGNLAQRTLSLIARHCEGKLPRQDEHTVEDKALLSQAHALLGQARIFIDAQQFHEILEKIWQVIRACNAYIDAQAPWALKKTDLSRMETVLRVLTDTLRVIGTLLLPFMPDTMGKLLTQLGIPKGEYSFASLATPLPEGTILPPPQGVFPRYQPAA